MSKNFWAFYIAFFVFVFPLFFSFSAEYIWSPFWSTVSLVIGFIGWIIFIAFAYSQTILKPRKVKENLNLLSQKGRLEQGKILDKILLKKRNNGMEDIEIIVQFKNLSDTMVNYSFQFTDSSPHEKRYEQGNRVNLRLATEDQFPGVMLADTQPSFSSKFGIFILLFIIVYMVGTFIAHYHFYSNGNGWRFITLWHPWVFTPFEGLLFYGLTGILTRNFGGSAKQDEKLILHGRKAEATVQRADQTGTYINEQPQIKFMLKFDDYKGQTHNVVLKKIVQLTELHSVGTGTRNILYLPENPEKIMFVD